MKFCFWIWLTPFVAFANELPPPVLPAGVGVNIHFVRGHEHDLDLIAAAGFKFVRMDFAWNSIEHQKGDYDWSAYEELTRNLEQRGLSGVYILDYSHSAYEEKVESHNALKNGVAERDTASPQHPGSIAAYSRWAAAAVEHFHGRHIVWEIWNEPNGFFWKPKPDAEQYTALALSAAKAIRDTEPDVTLIGPALAGFQPQYMETFLKSGILKYLDAVSVHPYRDAKHGPETAGPDYEKLRVKIEFYGENAARKKLPILSGEWGYSSKAGSISPETQAAYLVRQQLFNLYNGVPLSIWYDWQDDGKDPNEVEHHFGTVANDLAPKPAYRAITVMTHQLRGYRIERRLDTDKDDYVLLLTDNSGHKKIAAWTSSTAHSMEVKPALNKSEVAAGIDGFGIALEAQPGDGSFIFQLEPMPRYFTLRTPIR